jgi:ornithine cyclodeaminase
MSLAVFDADAVRRNLPMAECIDLMADTQAAISRGDITLPLRSFVPLDDSNNALLVMPGALPTASVFGAKLLSLFPDNRAKDQPIIQGQILLFDGTTGEAVAVVEAASLTAIRTAAASAAATRALANPEASTLAILGYGVQAHSHLAAMREVRPVAEVRVWGPDLGKAAAFADEYADQLSIRAVPTVTEAIRQADLVCAVSAAHEPIIEGDSVAPGCHLNLVGVHTTRSREADGETLRRARLFTEITEFALAESGDIVLAIEEGMIDEGHIVGEIGAVLNGDLEGRRTADEITLYKSLGNTAQDLAAASHVLSRATAESAR